ncbi:MAG TPA: hypothetical protein HPP77_05720 [Candidatus Hydrogenedentes bacterium]|nr:hypothetical protein [Candidatus Hydrogenedentota bacterium]HIJ72668.1 hypothetical protein [Candidatus Hydrogenedentota bacterium]
MSEPMPPEEQEQGTPGEAEANFSKSCGSFALAVFGAVLGGIVGYLLFYLCVRKGIVMWALPGAFVGLGRAALARRKSWILACICGTGGLGLGLYIVNDALLGGIRTASAITLSIVVVGGVIAFWFGLGRTPDR